ncbi:IS66-like element accessory protein TnpA [Roseomonas sp. TAS13]|uniref:IS66-like element accessory protein TnpA n=1 Tax=Roseomonas sp. TAS13 TaxID=1926319 RepID=UPI00096A7E60|nr:transposase [Roseomonas sp. TAS13]
MLRTERVSGIEIISGVERRRQWRVEDKLRIVAEAERQGACFAEIARRHEVSRSVLWSWRKQVRSGDLAAEQTPVFMPMQIVSERAAMAVSLSAALPAGPAAPPASADPDVERGDRIEIVLPDGTALRVPETVGTAALRRVPSVLRG